jgi:hypothetical protein
MTIRTKELKSKFTASVNETVVAAVDAKVSALNITRSDAVEEAMKMWLIKKGEEEDEKYFETAAVEMNADAKYWNAITTASAKAHF